MSSARERMVERYLNGVMDAAEEREFLARMEADASLRRLVEADRAIVSGARKEMGAMPAAATEPGAGLLAKLAATPPTAAAVTGGGVGGGLLAGSTMKILVAAVGVAGIAVGAFLVAPLMDPKEPAPSAGRADSIPAVALPPRAVGHDTQAISPPADLRDPVASPDAHVGRSAAVAKSARKGMEQRRPAVEQPSQRNGAELLDEQLREKPTVFRNDTVKMKVRRGSHAQ